MFLVLSQMEEKSFHPPGVLASEATVDTTINPQTGWWNVQLIGLCFYPPEARHIKSLPMCSTPQVDIKSGIYTVKFRYKLLCEPPSTDLGCPVESETQKLFWKSIWRLNVPDKIKHFAANKRKFDEAKNTPRGRVSSFNRN